MRSRPLKHSVLIITRPVLVVYVFLFPILAYANVERGLRLCTSKLGRQFPDHLKLELCGAATSAAPADCVTELRYSRGLSDDDKVTLCRGVDSTAPARCYKGKQLPSEA